MGPGGPVSPDLLDDSSLGGRVIWTWMSRC